jgi:hypothetical protein
MSGNDSFAPLHICARRGDLESLNLLLDANASIILKTKSGQTATDIAQSKGYEDLYARLMQTRQQLPVIRVVDNINNNLNNLNQQQNQKILRKKTTIKDQINLNRLNDSDFININSNSNNKNLIANEDTLDQESPNNKIKLLKDLNNFSLKKQTINTDTNKINLNSNLNSYSIIGQNSNSNFNDENIVGLKKVLDQEKKNKYLLEEKVFFLFYFIFLFYNIVTI